MGVNCEMSVFTKYGAQFCVRRFPMKSLYDDLGGGRGGRIVPGVHSRNLFKISTKIDSN